MYRCIPHIINIAAQAFIAVVSPSSRKKKVQDGEDDDADASDFDGVETDQDDSPSNDLGTLNEDENDIDTQRYVQALQGDVLKKNRVLVQRFRGSGQRRQRLAETQHGLRMPILQLLKDMTVRWSSTYFMVDRTLEVYPVSSATCILLVTDGCAL
jgi:hypothetical protein